MKDEDQIRQLQLDYAALFDARDAENFAELYADDAVLVQIDGKEIRTREKFVKAVRNMPPRGDGYHKVGKTDIRIAGDSASATTHYHARSSVSGAYMTGRYEDEYRRTAGGWRFTRRAVFVETSSDQPPDA
jgi:uncharacterized protein (TIGR02246 family)